MSDPQPLGGSRAVAWMESKLAALGIDPTLPLPETPEPLPALEAAQERIPVEYRAAVADHPAVLAWVRAISEAAAAPSRGGRGRLELTTGASLLLHGSTGRGKTYQAYGAIRALTAAGCAVRWHATTAADLYADMRPRAGVDPEWQMRHIMRVPLLLLDDLGAARTTEWTDELTYRLINHRYSHRLPMLITTNLPPLRTAQVPAGQPVLRDKLGDRVLSRLAGMCELVEVTGSDRRFGAA
ncbi:ATP-binding protein [Streptomyces sp. NPDC050095]|uniref:ATP-binding protein n=1 Tax=unclassified Streptomyces TaxID=2593676 RepID=UPI00341F3CE2